MKRFNHEPLQQQMLDLLLQMGVCESSRQHLVSSIVETSLRGTDSHGINLFPHYVNAFNSGRINKSPSMSFEYRADSAAILDADHAIGHHAGAVAIQEAVAIAKRTGISIVTVKNSTHFGAAAYFGLQAAELGYLGFAFTNADALVKAENAKDSFFGTNPICFTAPLRDEAPLCLDMATSQVSWNKINNYRRENAELPKGWAFDEQGLDTQDPHAARSLSPSGGYKGFGLGMMVDILCAVLSGSIISKDIKPMYTSDIKDRRHISHCFMVVDISKFSQLASFKCQLQQMVDRIRQMEPLAEDPVMVPGDPEKRTRIVRLIDGIPVDNQKVFEFLQISRQFERCFIDE